MSLLLVLVGLLFVCSALSHQGRSQIGSPIIPNFVPVGGSLSTGGFVARDLPNGFGGFGKRDVFRRACGSSNLGACPNNPTVCCEIGGECCGNGRCCPTGNACQTNFQGDLICCPTGQDCSNLIPDNPCVDKTAVACANFSFCCPNNNSCSIVNGQNTCTPIGGVSVPPVVSSSTKAPTSSISRTASSITIQSITSSTKPVTSSATVSSPVIKSQTSSSITPSSIVSSAPVVSSSSPIVQTQLATVTTTLPPVVVTTTPPVTATAAPTTSNPQPVTSTPPQSTTVAIPGTIETTKPLDTPTSIVQPSTIIEYSTIISSIEISSGVFSPTDVVLSSTRIYTPSPNTTNPSTPTASRGAKSSTIAIIAGASVGGTLLLVAIGFIIFFCARRGRTPPQPEFIPPPVREPTVPVLPPDVPDRYRAVSMSTVSELTPAVSPAPRYSTMYAPPENIAEMQAPGYVPQEMEGGKYGYAATSHELPSQETYVDPRTQGYSGRGY